MARVLPSGEAAPRARSNRPTLHRTPHAASCSSIASAYAQSSLAHKQPLQVRLARSSLLVKPLRWAIGSELQIWW